MARYPNGRIPDSELVKLGTEHFATPATAKRLANLIADVLANEGILLRVTGGPNIYRSYAWQKFYWDVTPYPGAAYPGTSSHGGVYKGADCLAVDIDNWSQLGKAKFYRYARKHGFTVDVFSWEPWHIIDYNPWTMPSGGGSSTPSNPAIRIPEDENMTLLYITDDVDGNGRPGWALFNTRTGNWVPLVNDGSAAAQENANSWSRALGRSASYCSRQDALNLAAGIRATS